MTDITEPTTEPVTETTTEPVEASTDEPQETTAPATDAPEETTAPAAQETTVPAGEEITPRAASSVESGNFKGETLTVKLSLENAVSGTYCLDDSTPVSFTDGMAIKIGSDYNYKETITLTLTATGSDGTKSNQRLQYKKLKTMVPAFISAQPRQEDHLEGSLQRICIRRGDPTVRTRLTPTLYMAGRGDERYDAEQKLYYYEIPQDQLP